MPDLPAGFSGRPIHPDEDTAAIVELTTVAAVAEYGTADVDERMVRESFAIPSFDVERDSYIVFDTDGRAAGIAQFYDGEGAHVAPYVFMRVRPDLLDGPMPSVILGWIAERGPKNLNLAAPGARVAMRTDVASVNTAWIAALERAGWRHDRTDWTMEIDLVAAAPLPEPAWPDGIRVRSADLERDGRAIHAVEGDAFSDHYGYLPQPFEEWWHFRTRFFEPEPDLWFLAMDGEEIAGIALCSSRRPGKPDVGWVSSLGVRRPWRRRGLALAILHHAFRELAARGKPRAGLGVDSQNLTGATGLYEKAGMRVVRQGLEYELLLRDGHDIRTLSLEDHPVESAP